MQTVTLQEFKRSAGKAIIILTGFFCFYTFKLFKGHFHYETFIILIVSMLGILGIRQLLVLGDSTIKKEGRKMSFWMQLLLEQILIFGLGILSIYIFLAKGLYGLYLLIDNFSFGTLLYRLLIIIISFQLVSAVSKIQTVLKSIETSRPNEKE